jgi:hypothetical protein
MAVNRMMGVTYLLAGVVLSASVATAADDGGPSDTHAVQLSNCVVKAKRKPSDPHWIDMETHVLAPLTEPAGPQPPVDPPHLTRYGGVESDGLTPTGFFHAVCDEAGRWQLVDPDGGRFLSIGLNSVRPNDTRKGHETMRAKFGSKQAWARHTSKLLRENGFNTLGCWSYWRSVKAVDEPMPFVTQLNFMARYADKRGGSTQGRGHRDYPNDCIFVFDPGFAEFCERVAEEQLSGDRVQSDPWLLGRFSDNELPFPDDALDRYLTLDADDPGRREAARWLAVRRADADASSEKDAAAAPLADITDEDRQAFQQHVAETYFRICNAAIKRHDPNHMYLGCRFHGKALRRETLFRAAGKHVDVVSLNWYGRWSPHAGWMDDWVAWSGKPFLVTEWYAKGADSGLANTSGAGWLVQTQADRGRFYQHFTLKLLASKGCVGWHWFRYLDNDPEDVLIDPTNTDANKGMLNGAFEPYAPLLDAARTLNLQADDLRRLHAN